MEKEENDGQRIRRRGGGGGEGQAGEIGGGRETGK